MEREFYLLILSLSLLHHEVVTHKVNFCNITESYFVEVTKTETVLEFKKPSGFNLLGMFSNSNKYENVSKTVIGVEKRERIVEECCSGYKRKGEECVSIKDEKSVPKSTTISSTTISTLIAPNVAATEALAKQIPDSSTAEQSPVTEVKVLKPVIESSSPTESKLPESVSTESPSTEAKVPDSSSAEPSSESTPESKPNDVVSMESSSLEPSSSEPSSTESKPRDLATESSLPEPSPTEPKAIDVPTQPSSPEPVATEAKTEPTTAESSSPSTESKTPESVPSETSSELASSSEAAPTVPKAPESVLSEASSEPASSPEPTPSPEPSPSSEPAPPPEPAPSPEPAPTEPKAPESVPSEASSEPASTEPKAPESVPTESSPEPSSTPAPTESKAESVEPVIASTPPTQTNSPTVTDSSSTPEYPTNPDLVDELVVDPTAVDTDETTIINGRKRRSIIDIPSNSLDLDSNTESQIDLEFSLNDELYSRKEHHEIVVSDIEDVENDTTWIEVLELISFGAVVFLLVITIQASYDNEAVSSLWKSKNKDHNIDSYGEYWIYDSQASLEEV